MVDMRMRQKYIINRGLVKRQLGILKYIDALFHTVIHQDFFAPHLQTMTASRNLMIRTDESKFHTIPPKTSRAAGRIFPFINTQGAAKAP